MTNWFEPVEFNWEHGTRAQRTTLLGQALRGTSLREDSVASKLSTHETEDRNGRTEPTVQDGLARVHRIWAKRLAELESAKRHHEKVLRFGHGKP